MRIGVWLYALATIAFGILDIVWQTFESSHQPVSSLGQHIPALPVFACVAGLCLLASGIALLFPRSVRIGAVASAVLYFTFALVWLIRLGIVTHSVGFRMGIVVFLLGG